MCVRARVCAHAYPSSLLPIIMVSAKTEEGVCAGVMQVYVGVRASMLLAGQLTKGVMDTDLVGEGGGGGFASLHPYRVWFLTLLACRVPFCMCTAQHRLSSWARMTT